MDQFLQQNFLNSKWWKGGSTSFLNESYFAKKGDKVVFPNFMKE